MEQNSTPVRHDASREHPVASRSRLDRTAALILLILCACWGLAQVSIKVANTGISPVLQAGLRSLGATLLLLLWSHWRHIPLRTCDGTLRYGIAAGLLFAVEFLLLFWGLDFTSASRGVIFLYTSPFIVAIGAHLCVSGDRLTRLKVIGLLLAFVGVIIAFADGLRLPTRRELIGDSMCFAAAIAWGATTVLIKASPLVRISAEKTLLYQIGISALVLLPASVLLGEAGLFRLSPLVLLALAYQIVVVAFASYVTWFWLVRHYPASRLSAFLFLTPVFGVGFGGVLLDERVSLALAAALVLIASGIYLVNRPDSTSDNAMP